VRDYCSGFYTPKDLLAKNFCVPDSAFANIPSEELYIFKSDVPGPLAKDRVAGLGPIPITFTHRMSSLAYRDRFHIERFCSADYQAPPSSVDSAPLHACSNGLLRIRSLASKLKEAIQFTRR
jgi:hypothetical protein